MTTVTTLDTSLRDDFRSAMSAVAAAVSVVTILQDGRPHGTTVSAFTSLSMEPPMLLVSLDKRSSLLGKVAIGSRLGVNVLAAHQDDLALRFASKREDKFVDVAWREQDGAPALPDSQAWVSLDVDRLVEAGDHTLVLGGVVSADVAAHAPLTYWRRNFGTHQGF